MILEAEIRRKAFRVAGVEQVVIEDLALELERREIVALVGPSGCGKTTLLKIIGGIDRDFDGRLRWGTERPRIGTVFQEPRLLPWRTVWQNLTLVLPPGADPAPAAALLETLGLTGSRDVFAAHLSLGMARRLALARAFAIEPDLLLLDEPFVSLDERLAQTSRELLLETWRSRPRAALLVTHDLVEAAMLADRILLLAAHPARVVAAVEVPEGKRRQGAAAAAEIAAGLRQTRGAMLGEG